MALATAVLAIGQFVVDEKTGIWARDLPEEGTSVSAHFETDTLAFTIMPAISADFQHQGKRRAAGVYFEIMAKYAEKVGGVVIQHSNIGACRMPGDRLLASYPSIPLLFDRICPGFQSLLMNTEGESP